MRFVTISLLYLLLPILATAQDGLVFSHTEVVEISGVPKDELFDKAMHWINDNYGSSKEVIQTKDKDAGTIYTKGLFRHSEWDVIYFDMNIAVKDGKYKFEINDLKHEGHGGGYTSGNTYINKVEKIGGSLSDEKPDCRMPGKHWKKLRAFGSKKLSATVVSFKKSMKDKSFTDF